MQNATGHCSHSILMSIMYNEYNNNNNRYKYEYINNIDYIILGQLMKVTVKHKQAFVYCSQQTLKTYILILQKKNYQRTSSRTLV